jgi:hypothetical protein
MQGISAQKARAEKRPQQRRLGGRLGPPIPTASNAETSGQRSAKLPQLG